MGPDDGKPDSRIQTPLPKSEAGGAHWSRPCTRRLWDSLLFETESRFETARVVSQGPVGFRAWAESSVRGARAPQGLKDSRTQGSEILTSFRINLSLFGEKSGGDLWSGKGSLTLSKTGTDVRRHGLARGFPDDGSRP